ncbi:MAG: response regulator [Candidatus Omnitrophica bacterium]|nr:response regulator [Candidatus Omnitrophota bacterium]
MTAEKIMIIDDNDVLLKELQETLRLCGYDAKAVSDSRQASKVARKLKPNAILLDLRMNHANGFQVAQELKESKETAGIPIIAMSGYFPIENQSALLDMHNMDARIKKPFGISDLITEIETVLKKTA